MGRGERDGSVYLLSNPRNKEAMARLEAIAETTDGIELAERDLAARSEGDVLGYRQHGASILKLVDIMRDRKLIEAAHEDARRLLARDPLLSSPELAPLGAEVRAIFANVDDDALSGG